MRHSYAGGPPHGSHAPRDYVAPVRQNALIRARKVAPPRRGRRIRAGVSDTLATIGWLRRQGSIEAADKRLLAAEQCLRGKPIDLLRTYAENTWRTTDKAGENAATVLLAEIACGQPQRPR